MTILGKLCFLWLGCAGLLLAGAPARYLNPFQWPGQAELTLHRLQLQRWVNDHHPEPVRVSLKPEIC